MPSAPRRRSEFGISESDPRSSLNSQDRTSGGRGDLLNS